MIRTVGTSLAAFALVGALPAPASAVASASRVLLDGSVMRAVGVRIPANGIYSVRASTPKGTVWIVVDGPGLVLSTGMGDGARNLSPGDTGGLESGSQAEFRNLGGQPADLVLVGPKIDGADVENIDLGPGRTMEEHTPDNGVLIVALCALKVREVRQLGEPDDPRPGRSTVVSMGHGEVKWLKPGMRTLTNLLGSGVRFVWIGW